MTNTQQQNTLFAAAPDRVKELLKASNAGLREKRRAEWKQLMTRQRTNYGTERAPSAGPGQS